MDLPRNNSFEENYLQLREKEGRLYSDSVVRLLPEFSGSAPLSIEWKIRKQSAKRLVRHFKLKRPKTIIEVGCGNGWLIHHLQQHVSAEYLGIDINERELKQATRISNGNLSCFLYGNILSGAMSELRADMIIVASVAHYFPDLKLFIQQLLTLLSPGGEVHIIDTAFYNSNEAIKEAKNRSEKYFLEMKVNSKGLNYYHHSFDVLESFQFKIAYQPQRLINRLKRKLISDSPFPWIIINK